MQSNMHLYLIPHTWFTLNILKLKQGFTLLTILVAISFVILSAPANTWAAFINRTQGADSNSLLSTIPESFKNSQSFQDANSGKSGYNIEAVNGTRMFVAYYPVNVLSNTWTVLLIEPESHVR